MSASKDRYRDDFDREGQLTAWLSPDGRRFLISGTEHGYAMRSPDDWESDDEVEFEADVNGSVYFRGEPVGWTLPASVLRQAS